MKLCKDCKHFESRAGGVVEMGGGRIMGFSVPESVVCRAAIGANIKDPVTGESDLANTSSPFVCRSSELLCGAGAAWFEPIAP